MSTLSAAAPFAAEIRARQHRVEGLLSAQKLSAAYFTDRATIRYLVNFTGDDSALLFCQGQWRLLTDRRFTESAERETVNCRVAVHQNGIAETASARVKKEAVTAVGVEAERIPLAQAKAFKKNHQRVAALDAAGWATWRAQKSAGEIAAIRRSIKVAETAFRALKTRLRAGMNELEIKSELEYLAARGGAEAMSFPTIVAVGANSSLPHAQPGKTRWRRAGEILLIDFGVFVDGYASDLTRTLFLGKIPPLWRRRYEWVLAAQTAGIAAIGGEVAGSIPARAAAAIFRRQKCGRFFIHSLGHGIGLEIHEAPRLSVRAAAPLPVNSVVTVEPGLYYPGQGGIRIEDDVLVTASGAEVLSNLEKDAVNAAVG